MKSKTNRKAKSKRRAEPTAEKEKKTQATAGKKKNASVVGAGVPATVHEERVIARARRRVCTPNSTSETSLMSAVTLVSKSF